MVVGIFDDCDALKPIVDGIKSSGADIDRLRVLTYDEVPTELATTGLQIVWIGDVDRAIDSGDMGTGGTGVPGMRGSAAPGEVHGDELLESLSELGIPDGKTDEYARAVEGGKLIVGYPAFADATPIRQLFTSAGAAKIEEF